MTFEEKISRLEEIVRALENKDLSLKDSIEIYQEGKNLSKELNEELNSSLKKLSYIVENGEIKVFNEEETKDI